MSKLKWALIGGGAALGGYLLWRSVQKTISGVVEEAAAVAQEESEEARELLSSEAEKTRDWAQSEIDELKEEAPERAAGEVRERLPDWLRGGKWGAKSDVQRAIDEAMKEHEEEGE